MNHTFPIREPEFEIARSVERSRGGAQEAQIRFKQDETQPFLARLSQNCGVKLAVCVNTNTCETPIKNRNKISAW